MGRIFTLGSTPANSLGAFGFGKAKTKLWVAVPMAPGHADRQGLTLTRHCESLSDLEEEVEALKRDLDAVLQDARALSIPRGLKSP
jgi:hypothetical protein